MEAARVKRLPACEIVRLALNGDADLTLEDLDGDGAVGVVLLHAGGGLPW